MTVKPFSLAAMTVESVSSITPHEAIVIFVDAWENKYESGVPLKGSGHTNQVNDLVFNHKDTIYSIAMDDSLKTISVPKKTFCGESVSLGSQPKSLVVNPVDETTAIVITQEGIQVIANGVRSPFPAKLNFEPTCLAISPDGSEIAVGGEVS